MKYNFDTEIDRKGTNCIKYDFAKERSVPEDALSLWVADMDFATVPEVSEKLEKMARHGIFGYTDVKDDYYAAVTGWYKKRFGWEIDPGWIIKTPGIVFALAQCVRTYTKPGDAVLIQRPVYYPFSVVIRSNHRELVNSPLVLKDGRYEIDFDDLEEKLSRENVKMMILCSPHNPVGRVWTKEELIRLEEAALRHQVIVISDEIHSDFVWKDNVHYPLLSLDERYQANTVVCTAPSKTFNLAGLQCSNIVAADPALRKALQEELSAGGSDGLNMMGLAACQAAYEYGEEWLEEAKKYIFGNLLFMEDYLAGNIPQIRMIHPEGTYLAWLDCRALQLSEEKRLDLIRNRAKLWLDTGSMFGPEGNGFERVNAACTRKTLTQALRQLRDAVSSL